MTSPPTPILRACRSVRTPWDVDRIAIPRPPSTRGTSALDLYTRRPGLEMRRMPEIVRSRFGPYLSWMVMARSLPSPSTDEPVMYPSVTRISAIRSFSRDAGTTRSSLYAMLAFRMRVSMSATGSVMTMVDAPSPRCLRHARDLALMGQLPEADPAQQVLAEHGA